MSARAQIIHSHPQAAHKPPPGAPCNGCGVCCLMEPCPLGVLLSGRLQGACLALRWHGELRQYRCGAITVPDEVLRAGLPHRLRFLSPALLGLLKRWARRWVAAGVGCDCDVEVQRPG